MTLLALLTIPSLAPSDPPTIRLPIPIEIPAADERIYRDGWELLYGGLTDEVIRGIGEWRRANPWYPVR